MLLTEPSRASTTHRGALLGLDAVRLVARVLAAAVAAAGRALVVARGGVARAVVVAAVLHGRRAVGARVAGARALGREARPVRVAVVRRVRVLRVARDERVAGARDELEACVGHACVAVAEEGARVLLLGFVAGRVVAAVVWAVGVFGVGAPDFAVEVGAAV